MTPYPSLRPLRILALLAAVTAGGPALAEKADRGKPMEVLADKSSTNNLKDQISRFNGNVVVTQGTMTLKADRVEVRQATDGYYAGTAWGTPGVPVTYRQKRDNVDEWLEGAADRVEFDGRTEVLKLIGSGVVRRLRGKEVVDEITGSLITWNQGIEEFAVQGASAAPGGSASAPRARMVFTPPPGSAAASQAGSGRAPARAASEPR
ncbi:MAG: lipopolysaccharide transport periplasmic protein LptA [Proteobacteria bacterium]|nr:lipopolysaccharide transport periplasmic protein LptA [Pseudomonadota bacterium]